MTFHWHRTERRVWFLFVLASYIATHKGILVFIPLTVDFRLQMTCIYSVRCLSCKERSWLWLSFLRSANIGLLLLARLILC